MNERVELKFAKNETYNIKIEGIEEMNKSIFIDNYINGYKIFNMLLTEKKKDYYFNNIIAFLGERGSGKTSCMESFINSLDGISEEKIKLLSSSELKEQFQNYLGIMNGSRKIRKINIIEPTFFSKEINILELVISNMFKEFNQELLKNMSDKYNEKKNLLKKFQDIYKSMKYMKCSEAYRSSEIEELVQLSTSVSFKMNFKELVKEYLEFFNGFKLVISIDDIDLNTEYAYEMTEDIRKYLSIDNVVIVMALKLEQLKTVVVKNYTAENNELLKIKEYEIRIIEDIENRAEKYLLKLIPVERRLYLKDLDEYKCEFKISIDGIEIDTENRDFQRTILELIYKKTGIIFLPSKYGVNSIIPTNFRELVGFIAILGKLKNIFLEESNKEIIKESNYKILKKYIFDYWIKNKLTTELQEELKEFIKNDYNYRNLYLYTKLTERLPQNESQKKILAFQNSIFAISKFLSQIIKVDRKNKNYYFALKMINSFELYETYKNDKIGFKELVGDEYIQSEKLKEIEIDKKEIEKMLSSRSSEIRKMGEFLLFFIKLDGEIKPTKTKKAVEIYKFSLLAPLTNVLYPEKIFLRFGIQKENINLELIDTFSKIIYRNMDIIEEFVGFLEKQNIEEYKIFDSIKLLYLNKIKEFNEKIFFPIAEVESGLIELKNYLESLEANKKSRINSIEKKEEKKEEKVSIKE